MEHCARCGHALGVGHFCTNCGQPVDVAPEEWDGAGTGTAVRPAVPAAPADASVPRAEQPRPAPVPAPVPSPGVVPPGVVPRAAALPVDGPRYPLYADEVDEVDEVDEPVAPVAPAATPATVTPVDTAAGPTTARTGGAHALPRTRAARDPGGWVPWVVIGAALLLVGAMGLWLVTGGGDDSSASADPAAGAGRTPSPSPSGSTSRSARPTPKSGRGRRPSGPVVDAARLATASVPATAPPQRDVQGNLVRYGARNLLDGVPTTCWRMPGDATGRELTLHLGARTSLTRVGLVNGYAKTATEGPGRRLDWYHGNRRVLGVQWIFDDGSTLTQSLDDTRRMQTMRISPVTTRRVRMRLVAISPPGTGPAGRDYTAISDVRLVGRRG